MAQQLPIDKAAMTAVRSALSLMVENEHLLKLAEEAGFNVAEERARFEHYKGLATQILATYEPIIFKLQKSEM